MDFDCGFFEVDLEVGVGGEAGYEGFCDLLEAAFEGIILSAGEMVLDEFDCVVGVHVGEFCGVSITIQDFLGCFWMENFGGVF